MNELISVISETIKVINKTVVLVWLLLQTEYISRDLMLEEVGSGTCEGRYDCLSFVEGRAKAGDVKDPARVPYCHGGCYRSTLVLCYYGGPLVNVPFVSFGGTGNTSSQTGCWGSWDLIWCNVNKVNWLLRMHPPLP